MVRFFLLGLALCAAAGNPVALPNGGSIGYSVHESQTRFAIRTKDGKVHQLSVARDSTVSGKLPPADVKVVGELDNSAVILVDAYPSVPGGMSLCQAGEEKFLRVISIAKAPRQTFSVKLESCRQTIELAESGVEWKPESSTLTIHWPSGPSQTGKAETRAIRINRDGEPETH